MKWALYDLSWNHCKLHMFCNTKYRKVKSGIPARVQYSCYLHTLRVIAESSDYGAPAGYTDGRMVDRWINDLADHWNCELPAGLPHQLASLEAVGCQHAPPIARRGTLDRQPS